MPSRSIDPPATATLPFISDAESRRTHQTQRTNSSSIASKSKAGFKAVKIGAVLLLLVFSLLQNFRALQFLRHHRLQNDNDNDDRYKDKEELPILEDESSSLSKKLGNSLEDIDTANKAADPSIHHSTADEDVSLEEDQQQKDDQKQNDVSLEEADAKKDGVDIAKNAAAHIQVSLKDNENIIITGKDVSRSTDVVDTCDEGYLKMNPDVAKAVKEGKFQSGLQHWKEHGKREGRKPYCEEWYLNGGDVTIAPSHFAPSDHGGQAVLCCIAMDEEAYIDEFVDYHIGIGFNKIIIYDNSNENKLKRWGQKRHDSTAEVIHYPGTNMQGRAYLDCAKGAHYIGKMKWAAFFDVDEFLVLKKHDNVDRFLDEHLSSGALGINWYMFHQGGETIYKPLPVTKRFVYRDNHTNMHVKSIVRLRDMDMTAPLHPHYPKLINGTQHDTNGTAFEGPFNAGGPSDIAMLHHYRTKSFQEYISKRLRGRADMTNWNPSNPSPGYEQRVKSAIADYNNALRDDGNRQMSGVVDDSAWRIMKKVSPKYAFYDSFN